MGGAIFLGSMWWYYQRVFKQNKNFVSLALFTVGSMFVSDIYARTLFVPPLQEAVMLNNSEEIKHREALKKKWR